MQTTEDILKKLKPYISNEPSHWKEHFEYHQRNRWWITPRDYIHIYYLSFKRKLKKIMGM
jgi:hypothetical protein